MVLKRFLVRFLRSIAGKLLISEIAIYPKSKNPTA